ncbi:PKD domain-containing protein [Methanotorris formicicus]|uniref:PKD domain containing protein n=1 Tax=Methanotorris formicicus Mc-S-70 TaxID=647171 RepID=H1KX78_9EURY|nr:PKD domain-containing protein [Methanotorris formicicus]EHP88509.1 PKD domain containing protein [Methanotorris formicicus Mc-S-70]
MKTLPMILSILLVLGVLPLSFASDENVAIVVSTPADAIVAAPYAKAMGYLLVYTPTDELSDNAKRELERNNINKVIIVGGPVAVSNNVENELKSDLKLKIERIWGETRVETSQKVFETLIKEKPEITKNIVITEGFNENVSPVAVSFNAPILYYAPGKENKTIETLKLVKDAENVIIIGTTVPPKVKDIASSIAKKTIIATGKDDTVIKTALSYVAKINPNVKNEEVAVVYSEIDKDPILDAIMNFVEGRVNAIVPLPEKSRDTIEKIIGKIATFTSKISIACDVPSVSDIISSIASKTDITTVSTVTPTFAKSVTTKYRPPVVVDNKPTINKFDISTDGLKTAFTINVSDDNGLKKIVLTYGDGTKFEKEISGTSYSLNISRNYLMQGVYTATLTVYDNKDQANTASKSVNLRYFDITPEHISKTILSGNINESIPITIKNYQNKTISINAISPTGLNVSINNNSINTTGSVICRIINTSALTSGKAYQAKVVFALDKHPEINKTFVLDIIIPKIENKTTTSGKTVSLQIVNTTVAENTSIEINDNTTNAFIVNTTVGDKSIDIIIPTTNTSDTSTIENTTIHLENIKEVLERAEKVKNTSTLTEETIRPVVIASKDVNNVSVDVKNVTIDETKNEATINTEISFNKSTNDTYVVVAIPVGNNSVSKVYKEGLGTIPEYDGTGTQINYFRYDATNGILTLFLKDDPLVSITLSVKVVNQPPVISYTYIEDGLNVLINASESYDPEGKTLTFKWLAPGNQSVSYLEDGKTINITYPKSGTYDITLIVSDGVYEVSSVITVSVTQPVAEKPAIKVIANGKTIEFAGQSDNTLTISTPHTIKFPTIDATVNVVDKEDTEKGVRIYFKDNESVESIIKAMNVFNKIAYDEEGVNITYYNPEMKGKNVSLIIIPDRNEFRNAMNKLLNGDATKFFELLNNSYGTTTVDSNGYAKFTITANSSHKDDIVLILDNESYIDNTYAKILAVGGFEVMKYNMTLTFNGTDVFNTTTYIISLNDTPSNPVRYGLAMINKNVGITLDVIGTNPNNNLFNVSVVGNNGSEIVVENNDFITLSASKINDIIGTIFTPDTASATYSSIITNSTVSLDLNNVSDAYVIGIAYDTVDKKIVAVEQQ